MLVASAAFELLESCLLIPLMLSYKAWDSLELLRLIQTKSGLNPTPVIAWDTSVPVYKTVLK